MKKFLLAITIAITSCFLLTMPAFAADTVECTCASGERGTRPAASILNSDKFCDCGNGEAIMAILGLVVDIMTIGIGILAAVGITIVGIQYLTAGGSEEKTKKAKRRLIEIVIGVAVFVVLYAALKFLIPGFGN